MNDGADEHGAGNAQTIYLDTNILVSILTEDSLSTSAIEWLDAQTAPLAISEWVCAEFNAVAGLRTRKGELKRDVAVLAMDTLQRRSRSHFAMLPVNNAATVAAEWLRNPDCTLQTNDALHLAIAHGGGATKLATFDERFAKAAQKLRLHNLKIELIRVAPKRVAQNRAAYVVAPKAVRPKATTKAAARKK